MDILNFEGFMIPGLYFENNYCFWIINWDKNTSEFEGLKEIIVFKPDGRTVCYITPNNTKEFFERYHTVDKIEYAKIKVRKMFNKIEITVLNDTQEILKIDIKYKLSFGKIATIGNYGKTETGKFYHNIPRKILNIKFARLTYEKQSYKIDQSPDKDLYFSDTKVSKNPIICYCSHRLEA